MNAKIIVTIIYVLLTLGAFVYGSKKQVDIPFTAEAEAIHF